MNRMAPLSLSTATSPQIQNADLGGEVSAEEFKAAVVEPYMAIEDGGTEAHLAFLGIAPEVWDKVNDEQSE